MVPVSGKILPFEYIVEQTEGRTCLLCLATDRALLCLKPEKDGRVEIGICETCAIASDWIWRRIAGEVPTQHEEKEIRRIQTVKVLVPRLIKLYSTEGATEVDKDGKPIPVLVSQPPEFSYSYEFMMLPDAQQHGIYDLPGISVGVDDDISTASMKALNEIGLVTWAPCLELLFVGYTPRGRLIAVYLARAWAIGDRGIVKGVEIKEYDESQLTWKKWPIASHAGPLAGFYKALESVWPLRLERQDANSITPEITIYCQKAAREYIDLMIAKKLNSKIDFSLQDVYFNAMTDGEKCVHRLITKDVEKKQDEGAIIKVKPSAVAAAIPSTSATKPKSSRTGDKDEAWPELGIEDTSSQKKEEPPVVTDDSEYEEIEGLGNDDPDSEDGEDDSFDDDENMMPQEGDEEDGGGDRDGDENDEDDGSGFVRPPPPSISEEPPETDPPRRMPPSRRRR